MCERQRHQALLVSIPCFALSYTYTYDPLLVPVPESCIVKTKQDQTIMKEPLNPYARTEQYISFHPTCFP